MIRCSSPPPMIDRIEKVATESGSATMDGNGTRRKDKRKGGGSVEDPVDLISDEDVGGTLSRDESRKKGGMHSDDNRVTDIKRVRTMVEKEDNEEKHIKNGNTKKKT